MLRKFKKAFSVFMVIGVLLNFYAPVIVFALEEESTITIGGNATLNSSTFEYANGDVTITKNSNAVDTTSFTVKKGDQIVITLTPQLGYYCQLQKNGVYVNLTNNTYNYTIGDESTILFIPSFQEPPASAIKYDFTYNGVDFTDVADGDTVTVPDNFNLDEINELYITKIAINGVQPVTYEPNEYSYALLDSQDRRIFEINFTKESANYGFMRILSHSNDILPANLKPGKTNADYFGFYITNIKFVKNSFKGVQVSTGVMPDNYDFTIWNGADLNSTTKSNPGKVTAYYGDDTITFSSKVLSGIEEISLVADSGIPSSAVDIDNETGKVKILSNYYNEIPLQIKLKDGTIGYITVDRIGIFISELGAGVNTLYHGASMPLTGNLNVDTDKNRIAAVFYHEDSTTYEDYNLIVNITYKDGKTETKIAKGVGDVQNSEGNIVGSDYILWSGNKTSEPEKVSVTAVKKGAINSESTTFSGATFGSGSGVEWERN